MANVYRLLSMEMDGTSRRSRKARRASFRRNDDNDSEVDDPGGDNEDELDRSP